MEGTIALVARLLYGTGMRLMEGLRLRIKDVDFDRKVIIVREAKGNKDRVVMLPTSLIPALQGQIAAARVAWLQDRQAQHPGVEVPHALEKNIRGWDKAGDGFGSSHHHLWRRARTVVLCAGTISTRNAFNAPSRRPYRKQQYTSQSQHIPFAIALPLICCKREQTSVLSRSCLGIAT
jgi:integrase